VEKNGISMNQRLKDKNVLVTAAAQGIGRASALAMAVEGAKVFATDVNMQALATIRDENREDIEIFELDVRDGPSVAAGVERAQPDVLFNCAGYVNHGTILDASDEDWEFAFD
jgi:2-keto-3-deoxy-L-fuconate dehydrogenase